MEHAVVALVPCDSYDQAAVDAAVKAGADLLGGISRFVRPEEKILVKPNLLSRALPQKAITTHPAVFGAVLKLLRDEHYAQVIYGDSPGHPGMTALKCAEGCGLTGPAEQYGVPIGDFDHCSLVRWPEGRVCKSFHLSSAVQEADAVINVCKMKTHALERITGAVKNMYGCITGLNKGAGHISYPDSNVFADMLCELSQCVRPRLHIMDGITAMEGNGPSSGTPVDMHVLLFSDDPVALDTVFASLVHLDPQLVPTCVSGMKYGLGTADPAQITVRTPDGDLTVQEAVSTYGNASFDVFRGKLKKHLLAKAAPLLPFLQERPKADPKKCIACGICEQACPVPEKAVHSGHGKVAVYDYHKCVRCFCCQEMCPAKAIYVYRNPLTKLLGSR